MKRTLTVSLFAMAAFAFAACAPPASTNTNSNTNVNTNANSAAKTAMPTADALLAMENKAWEAWKNRDAKYFEGFVADNFVGFERGQRLTKAEMIKSLTEKPCDVKSFSLSEPHVTPVSNDAAVITYKGTADASCGGQKLPSPVTAATVFVRSGDAWKAAYHGEVPVATGAPAADASSEKKPAAEKPAPPADATAANSANANSNANTTASGDALTDALTAMERKGWESWMKQDAAGLQAVTTKDVTFLDAMGKATHGQTEAMKVWISDACKVTSVNISDGKAAQIAPNVAIFTYKGTAEGTCGDMKLTPLWGMTVAVKEGDMWKAAYLFESPM